MTNFKTIFIWDELDQNIKFFVLDGDYTHLDGIYINNYCDEVQTKELLALVYDENGDKIIEMDTKFPTSTFEDGNFYHGDLVIEVVTCGFIG